MKVIYFPLRDVYRDFLKETEGVAWPGWTCPIWATIENDELKLRLGSPVSQGTIFVNQDGKMHPDWIDNVKCWKFNGTAENYEEYGLDSPADFDREVEIECEIDKFIDSFDFSELEKEIEKYCNERGYDVEFI